MKRINVYKLLAVLMASIVAGMFVLCDLGLGITPLTKFFVIFFGAIIGMQSAPAALQFIGMIKGEAINGSARQLLHTGGEASYMKARKILIADKDSVNRKQLAELFENSHYDIETTASAAYAIAKIVQKNEPIVILGDSFEEEIASSDVVALMHKWNKSLRIILVSDDSSLDSLSRMQEDGAFYHALKPHSEEENEELRLTVKRAAEAFHPAMS